MSDKQTTEKSRRHHQLVSVVSWVVCYGMAAAFTAFYASIIWVVWVDTTMSVGARIAVTLMCVVTAAVCVRDWCRIHRDINPR